MTIASTVPLFFLNHNCFYRSASMLSSILMGIVLQKHHCFLQLVQLQFLSFDFVVRTSCRTTSVSIYDGNDTSTPLLNSFCRGSLPVDTISSGNTVLVYFKTGCSDTSGGFSVYYSAFTPVEGTCYCITGDIILGETTVVVLVLWFSK